MAVDGHWCQPALHSSTSERQHTSHLMNSWNQPQTSTYKSYTGGVIRVARILSGVHIFLKKVDDLLVVTLKTRSETTKWTTPTSKSPPHNKYVLKNWLLLCRGALTNFSRKFRLKKFSPPWGMQVHPLHPLATPRGGVMPKCLDEPKRRVETCFMIEVILNPLSSMNSQQYHSLQKLIVGYTLKIRNT